MRKVIEKLKKEIYSHKLTYLLLGLILVGGFFIRIYRIDQNLGFYFDQGRDAKVIWDFWHKGKIFLIGPTTGIAGIFRGPFYYYFIAPFYLLGGGNPVWPSMFLSFTTIAAILIMYSLAAKYFSRATGLIAATIASFSFNMMYASKWLSNPTPMMLLSIVLVWMVFLAIEGKKWAWPVIAFIAGLSLFHFGSAGEVFYFPALLIIFIWQLVKNKWRFEKVIGGKYFILSVAAFLFTASPLILFDIRHDGILRNNIYKFIFSEGSFKSNFWDVFKVRLWFYEDVFYNKVFHWKMPLQIWLFSTVIGYFLIFLPRFWKNDYYKALLILFFSPILGLLFFQGNFGNIYDYYLTGYYLIFIFMFAIVMGELWRSKIGKIFVIYFLLVLLRYEGEIVKVNISSRIDGVETILFGNQKQAIDWVYEDAQGREFSVDVYVPPVIPHAYDYLFIWFGAKYYPVSSDLVNPLYLIYEVDVPHPERLEEWMKRQEGISKIEDEKSFGGITVQKRVRL